MRINFLRKGFANNSSSTHSIVFTSDTEGLHDVDCEDFGWANFLCVSKEMKLNYLLCMLKGQFLGDTDDALEDSVIHFLCNTVARKIMSDEYDKLSITEKEFTELSSRVKEYITDSTVDHQSVFGFPNMQGSVIYDSDGSPKGSCIDMDFVYEFCRYIVNNNYVIGGGNDNDDEPNPYIPEKSEDVIDLYKVIDFLFSGDTSSVKDEDNWVLYSKCNGSELCFSFKEGTKVSSFPTLVDLKITDKCTHGCSHCYQGSSYNGEHSKEDLDNLVYSLKSAGTGTIAIGGGNPLLYPGIKDLCNSVSRYMTCCLTLNTISREDIPFVSELMGIVDSIAVTCNKSESVIRTLIPFLSAMYICKSKKKAKIYVQGILEFFKDENDFECYLKNIKAMGINNVTLLGYKTVGRATDKPLPNVNYNWVNVCKKSGLNIGVDACIVSRYKNDIEGVKPYLLCNEGDRSMYIDAVSRTINKDSYSDKSTEIGIGSRYSLSSSKIREIFMSFKKNDCIS